MRSALTRLTLLFGVCTVLCLASGPGLALAGNDCNQSNNPVACQYYEGGGQPTLPKHKPAKHTRTQTTTPGGTATTQAGQKLPAAGTRGTSTRRHHKHKDRRKSGKHPVRQGSAGARRGHNSSGQPHSATKLTAAVVNGSSGGMGVWLLVILILVLLSGSAVGILRYRRNR